MNTTATTGPQALEALQPSAQLKVNINLLQPADATAAVGALLHPDNQLVYDEKCCGFTLVTYSHPDGPAIKTLQASIQLEHASLHFGQFAPGAVFDLVRGSDLLGTATVVAVLEKGLGYWDWDNLPQDFEPYARPFSMDQLECFLLHLEFDLLDLPFLQDYTIQRSRTDDYAVDLRLSTATGSVTHQQALRILDTMKQQPCEYCCIKPGFYQLSSGRQLENFECHFIFGNGDKSVTGRLIVL